jgi:hypothetical protein
MNADLADLVKIRDLSFSDFEQFKTCLRMLTGKTFIIRGIEKEGGLYDFALRNIRLLEAWCACMDAELAVDESLGVIAFRGPASMRFHFTREEICAVLTLRLLYEDKKTEVTLTRFPVATVSEFRQKYNAATGGELKKTALEAILSRLSACRLIGMQSADLSDEGALIELYPSIPMSIDRAALDQAIAELDKKKIPHAKEEEEEPHAEDAESAEEDSDGDA